MQIRDKIKLERISSMRIRARNFYVVLNAASRLTDFFLNVLNYLAKKETKQRVVSHHTLDAILKKPAENVFRLKLETTKGKVAKKTVGYKKTKWTRRVRSGNDIAQMIFQDSCMFLRMKRMWQRKYRVIPTNSFEYLLAKLIKLIRRNWFMNHKLLNGNLYCVCGFNNIQKDSSL